MLKRILLAAALAFSALGTVAVRADDATLHQIYEAANSGQLDRAQGMIAQVLRDHPNSAKAHYVAAELDARQNRMAAAREEFATAERLQPGLPFAKPDAVSALRAQLGAGSSSVRAPVAARSPSAESTPRIPVVPLLLGFGLIAVVVWMLGRRRAAAVANYPASYPSAGMPPGYGPAGVPSAGGGIGSGIAGGLATGLGVGAGIVAGEALADRLLHGSHERSESYGALPPDPAPQHLNPDMGGSDFGVNDSGSSWDDGGGVSDSGGGDSDWS